MKQIHLNRILLLILIITSAISRLQAQAVTMDSATVRGTLEMNYIQLAAAAYDGQQFNFNVFSSNGVVSDTSIGTCSIQGLNYRTVFDSVEQVQDNYVNLQVHASGKILIASRPQAFTTNLFKEGVANELFGQMNINTISIANGTGVNKILVFNFLPESSYTDYKITYDSTNYRVSDIFVKLKVPDDAGGFIPSSFYTIHTTLTNFVTLTPGMVSFSTSPYVAIGTGNTLVKQPAYADYELVNLMDTE